MNMPDFSANFFLLSYSPTVLWHTSLCGFQFHWMRRCNVLQFRFIFNQILIRKYGNHQWKYFDALGRWTTVSIFLTYKFLQKSHLYCVCLEIKPKTIVYGGLDGGSVCLFRSMHWKCDRCSDRFFSRYIEILETKVWKVYVQNGSCERISDIRRMNMTVLSRTCSTYHGPAERWCTVRSVIYGLRRYSWYCIFFFIDLCH